jgi:TRAP-type C4-dicarboxylate transport system permease small subunit
MTLSRYISRAENGLAIVGKGLLFLLMTLVFLNAVMRYVFNSPVTGVIQFIEDYVLIGMVFLLLSTVEHQQDHIKVDILADRIPTGVRKAIYIISSVATIVIFAYVIRAFVQVAYTQWQRNALSGTWEYPIAPARVLIAFGLFLLCIRIGYNIWRALSDG